MGSIIVVNSSSSPIWVFVSKYTNDNGSDQWYKLEPGQRDSWSRNGWEAVGFKNVQDTDRAGTYVRVNNVMWWEERKENV
ncbi:hypothetical protein L227DRAFT_23765 [Lentinus tigrinus ALCF2SS1-6]|uniref:Uncharacterized protein n=1 Tax=Lentinus tigrinus ALCF2SS1-6 TaxID=1328759 RepID=A0A5C2SVZ3_9APHY|nr:hypothetical protein L227DRAFT_23765 [Lentinus tigrinus ALCF2SS1-6]